MVIEVIEFGPKIQTSQMYGLFVTSLKNHLYGITQFKIKEKKMIHKEEKEALVFYVKKMQAIEHLLTLTQLQLKAIEIT
jgi:hypothetical protein